MRLIAISVAGALTLTACATPGPEESGSPNRPLAVDLTCPREPGYLVLGASPAVARQGAQLTISASVSPAPWSATPLPTACLREVEISPAGAATLGPGAETLTLAADATPGSLITVTARYGQETGRMELRVVGRDEVVLTGTWRQERVKCDPGLEPGEPIRELKFTGDGRFNVTWQPFESYVDYWGPMTFDATTGAIVLTPEGGNFTPPLLDVEGTARLDAPNRLILENVYLGARNERNPQPRVNEKGEWLMGPDGQPIFDQPSCSYEFTR